MTSPGLAESKAAFSCSDVATGTVVAGQSTSWSEGRGPCPGRASIAAWLIGSLPEADFFLDLPGDVFPGEGAGSAVAVFAGAGGAVVGAGADAATGGCRERAIPVRAATRRRITPALLLLVTAPARRHVRLRGQDPRGGGSSWAGARRKSPG